MEADENSKMNVMEQFPPTPGEDNEKSCDISKICDQQEMGVEAVEQDRLLSDEIELQQHRVLSDEIEQGLLSTEIEQQEQPLTETEKQLHDIMEENDKQTYEADLDKYLDTESSDLAALNSAVLKRGVPAVESRVVEMFPMGRRYERYTVVADGWFMYQRHRANNGTTTFSCRYGAAHGCKFEIKLKNQKIEWGVPHNHSSEEIEECPNFHFMCPYCEERFTSPGDRRDHILKVPHKDAPWPMIEDLCVMAQFDTSSTVELPGNKLGMWEWRRGIFYTLVLSLIFLAPDSALLSSRGAIYKLNKEVQIQTLTYVSMLLHIILMICNSIETCVNV
eukprot:sb/3466592/